MNSIAGYTFEIPDLAWVGLPQGEPLIGEGDVPQIYGGNQRGAGIASFSPTGRIASDLSRIGVAYLFFYSDHSISIESLVIQPYWHPNPRTSPRKEAANFSVPASFQPHTISFL